jgi:hypothetical protein
LLTVLLDEKFIPLKAGSPVTPTTDALSKDGALFLVMVVDSLAGREVYPAKGGKSSHPDKY